MSVALPYSFPLSTGVEDLLFDACGLVQICSRGVVRGMQTWYLEADQYWLVGRRTDGTLAGYQEIRREGGKYIECSNIDFSDLPRPLQELFGEAPKA